MQLLARQVTSCAPEPFRHVEHWQRRSSVRPHLLVRLSVLQNDQPSSRDDDLTHVQSATKFNLGFHGTTFAEAIAALRVGSDTLRVLPIFWV
jgi:hypothetical protein